VGGSLKLNLKEGSLGRIKSSVSRGDNNINWCNKANTCWSSHLFKMNKLESTSIIPTNKEIGIDFFKISGKDLFKAHKQLCSLNSLTYI
jgi:hypothetical protein